MPVLNAPPAIVDASSEWSVTTRVLLDEREWEAIRAEWDALHAASPTASSALDYTWLRNWWRVYAPTLRARSLRIVLIRRGPQLIGAIPLYLRRGRGGPLGLRCLGFVSTGEAEFEETCPDYLNLLCLPGAEALCAERVWRVVESLAWDKVELLDVPADAELMHSVRAPRGIQRFARGKCPIADLSGGFDAYLARLSPNSRQQARRLLREGERAGVRLELIQMPQMASAIDDMVRLHQARWIAAGKPGVFAAPRFLEFHRGLIGQQLPLGRVALARLWLGDDAFAVLYGFISGDKFEFYQSGIRHDSGEALQSPGNLAHLLFMRALAERGITAYDFLRGSASYKQRLATRDVDLIGAQVWRRTLRTVAYRSVRFAGRAVKRAWRLLRPRSRRGVMVSSASAVAAGTARRGVTIRRAPMLALAAALAMAFAPSVAAQWRGEVQAPPTECASTASIDLTRIHGRIQIVESFPDYKVKVVDSFADLHVQMVDSFPDAPGKWKRVESFPDYRIQFVESFPDFTIRYVQSFPGVQ